MNVILLSRRDGRARQFNLARPVTLGAVLAVTALIVGGAFALGLQLGRGVHREVALAETTRFAGLLAEQKQEIASLKQQLQLRVDAMAMRIGEVNAHVIRLDALGKRLTEMADIDSREFDFDRDPPSGGPEGEGVSAQIPDLSGMLVQLEQRADLRESQLAALENVILTRELKRRDPPGRAPRVERLHLLLLRRACRSFRRPGEVPQGRGLRRRLGHATWSRSPPAS